MDHRRLLAFFAVAVLWFRVSSSPAGCNSTTPGEVIELESGGGVLDWPDGPAEYTINQECYWLIVVPIGKVVRYKFNVLSFEDYDYLLIDDYQHKEITHAYWEHYIGESALNFTTVSAGNTMTIRFQAYAVDLNKVYNYTTDKENYGGRFGFHIEYEVADNECPAEGKNITVTGSGLLDYPVNYDRYGRNISCYWTLVAPEDKIFRYNLTKTDLAEDDYDYLEIDGEEFSGSMLSNASSYTESYVSTSNILNILFYSDKSLMGTGFTITWDLADAPPPYVCNSVAPGVVIQLESGGGVLDWPGGPAEYPIDQICYWVIMVPIGKVIRYKFNILSFEYDDYIYLEEYGHTYVDQYYLAAHGLDVLGATTASKGNVMTIVMTTYSKDSNTTSDYDLDKEKYEGRFGFHMEYEVAENECPADGKNITVAGSGGLDYPANHDRYARYRDCSWRLVAPESKVFRYKFTKLSVENATYADKLKIGENDSSEYTTFQGVTIPSNPDTSDGSYLTASNILNIIFESDSGVIYSGFSIIWTLEGSTHCEVCMDDSGVCVHPYENGTFGKCQCPAYNCSSSIENGCDVSCGCAPVNSPCDLDETVPCWDVNAECVIHGLSSYRVCACRFGYVAVYNDEQPIRCHRRLSRVEDSECTECIENGGVCYDNADNEDSYEDGCICPPTRVTNSTHCDTQLFAISCTQDNMTVCFDPPSHIPGHENITAMLDAEQYLLFAKGFLDVRACHFTKADSQYCLTLGFAGNDCGMSMANTTVSTSYSTELRFHKNVEIETSEDMGLFAYCSFHKQLRAVSGALDVLDTRRTGMEGRIHQATLGIVIMNMNNEDLKETGLMTGDEMKIRLWISDDADGLYTSLEAEVCVISDQLSLNHPVANTVPIILHGCPVTPLLSSDEKFRTVGSNLSAIETGMFPAPKFPGTSYIFVHCAVRTCFKDEACSLNVCEDTGVGRRRRSVVDTGRYIMNTLLDDPSIQHRYIAVQYRQSDVSAIGADGVDKPLNSGILILWTSVTICGTLFLIVVALAAAVLRHSIRRRQCTDVVFAL